MIDLTKLPPDDAERIAYTEGFTGVGELFARISDLECTLEAFTDEQDRPRVWVGLTDEEIFDVWLSETPAPNKIFYQKLCRSIEAKLKELNT